MIKLDIRKLLFKMKSIHIYQYVMSFVICEYNVAKKTCENHRYTFFNSNYNKDHD